MARQGGRRAGAAEDEETTGVLADRDLNDVEKAYPEGMTAAQVVELFTGRGIKLSEATSRKYVQLGLLPRSRRVGRKGKHRGSMGLYPANSIHQVTPVTSGARYAAFFWIQSLVREQTRRSLLLELDDSIQALAMRDPADPEVVRLTGLYHNLLREWAST